jgi:carbon monoxide dehydrogenase subunit G
MRQHHAGSVSIEQHINTTPETVASFIGDFRNAKDWMVGIEGVEQLGENSYRLTLHGPIGKLEPEAKVVEHGPRSIRWIYTSTVEGGGRVDVSPSEGAGGCVVSYTGEFRLKHKLLNRAARMVGVEHFARRNGERSLARLKHLMEARR